MKRNSLLIAILFLCLPLLAQAQTSDTKSEETPVRQAVESYLNKTSQTVLHRDAKIISTDGAGKRLIETSFDAKPGKLKKGETVGESSQRIVAVDMTTGGASVKVETEFASDAKLTPHKHIQYISLLKINGEWKIVSILMPPLKFAESVGK
jgi:Putative lumazine-binding